MAEKLPDPAHIHQDDIDYNRIMSKIILVPLDGSPVAEQVLPYAQACARQLGPEAELLLMRVLEPVDPAVLGPELARHQREEAKKYLTGIAVDLGAAGFRARIRSEQPGPVHEAITAVADEEKVALVALCSHGRTGLERLVLGSVAEKVLRHTTLPVLLVPAAESSFDWRQAPAPHFKTLLLTLDGSPLSELALEFGQTLPLAPERVHLVRSNDLGTPLSFARENQATRENLECIEAYLQERASSPNLAGAKVERHVCEGLACDVILERVEALDPDLVVMGTHGRSGLDHAAFGSVAAKVARHSPRPLLLLHGAHTRRSSLAQGERNVRIL